MSMSTTQIEREFEESLIEILSQDYDLPVRLQGEVLDRRRNSAATLCFQYRHSSPPLQAKAVVEIEGVNNFSVMLRLDCRNTETIRRSAEDCEALSLYLMEHFEQRNEALLARAETTPEMQYRREDDPI